MSDAAPTKEALCIILDVREGFRRHLPEALDALRALVHDKVLYHGQDVVSLFLHGTLETKNAMAEEMDDGTYAHIMELHPMAPVGKSGGRLMAALDRVMLEPHGGTADLIDSLCIGMMAVIDYVKKLKFGKKVVVITDGTSPCSVEDEQLEQITSQLTASQMSFQVMSAGMLAADSASRVGRGAAAAAAEEQEEEEETNRVACSETLRVLGSIERAVGSTLYSLTPLSHVASIVGALKRREVRSSTSFRGALQIGDLAIPVWSWRKVVGAQPPKMVAVSKAALDDPELAKDPSRTVETSRRYHLQGAPDVDVPPNLHVPGYRFGKDVIPVAGVDSERLKYGVAAKTLELIGTVRQAEVPRQMLVGRPECVVADREAVGEEAERALQALILALEENEMVGIARYAARKNAPPALVSLWPQLNCLWLLQIPFRDEMRRFDWGPPPRVPPPTAAQLTAASELIDAMDLTPASADHAEPLNLAADHPELHASASAADHADHGRGPLGRPLAEALKPKHVFSPKLQRTYQCIRHRARALISAEAPAASADVASLAASSVLPDPDTRFMAPLLPDPLIARRAAATVDAFAALCALEDSASSLAGKRARGSRGAIEASAHSTGGDTLPKRSRAETENVPLQLTYAVDSAMPVDSFHRMLDDSKEDRTEAAMEQMGEMAIFLLGEVRTQTSPTCSSIVSTRITPTPSPPTPTPTPPLHPALPPLPTPSPPRTPFSPTRPYAPQATTSADNVVEKAFTCLREMRRAAVKYDTPHAFNLTLHRLRELYRDGAAHQAAIWSALYRDHVGEGKALKHGLITRDEASPDDLHRPTPILTLWSTTLQLSHSHSLGLVPALTHPSFQTQPHHHLHPDHRREPSERERSDGLLAREQRRGRR